MGAYYKGFVSEEARSHGFTLDDLRAWKPAVTAASYVGRPGFTSLQNQARFYYVIRKFGISKTELGVVSHGLRHQYANDHFEADAGGPSPVRGGTPRPHGNKPARKRVSRVLGHNRERASTGYLGSDAGLPEAANDPAA